MTDAQRAPRTRKFIGEVIAALDGRGNEPIVVSASELVDLYRVAIAAQNYLQTSGHALGCSPNRDPFTCVCGRDGVGEALERVMYG